MGTALDHGPGVTAAEPVEPRKATGVSPIDREGLTVGPFNSIDDSVTHTVGRG